MKLLSTTCSTFCSPDSNTTLFALITTRAWWQGVMKHSYPPYFSELTNPLQGSEIMVPHL